MQFFNDDKIYHPKTREYFKEVVSSYSSGNYRSAISTLYSVVVCDLLFKLDELVDVYSDTKAMEILNSVDGVRENSKNFILSQWEGDLVQRIHRETKLLNDIAYKHFEDLKWHRNVAAHPVLNENHELYVPNQETVIALITNALQDVLTRPSIFIKDVVDSLTEDITARQGLYQEDRKKFQDFFKRKYYVHMDYPMKSKLFLTLWKFAFVGDKDPNCMNNLVGLRRALLALTETLSENEVKDIAQVNNAKCIVSLDDKCVENLMQFLAMCQHNMFSYLGVDTKNVITTKRDHIPNAKLYCWFIFDTVEAHFQYLNANTQNSTFAEWAVRRFVEHYREIGCISYVIGFCIDYYGKSNSYDCADDRYRNVICPILLFLTRGEQFEKLFDCINANSQIYNRRDAYYTNGQIVKCASRILPKDYNYSRYENLKFNERILEHHADTDVEETLITEF